MNQVIKTIMIAGLVITTFSSKCEEIDFDTSFLDCQENESRPCTCQDGSRGVQVCIPELGDFEACICSNQCVESPEVCDDVDNDCDGMVDEGATDAPAWYADRDGDGFGDENDIWISCDPPTGYVDNADDCDDQCKECWSEHPENCDGIDNDCNPQTEDGTDECQAGCNQGTFQCN